MRIFAAICVVVMAITANELEKLISWFGSGQTTTDAIHTVTLPLVTRTPGGLLEVATVSTTEVFERRSLLKVAGINLGTTVSEIRVPAVFRYQIKLAPDWRAYVRDGKLLVIAPVVTASLPVAIDTAKMEMKTSRGWARTNGLTNLTALNRDISATLEAKAKSPLYIEAQREHARKTVEEFVMKWLLEQERWKTVKSADISAYFADEPIERFQGSRTGLEISRF